MQLLSQNAKMKKSSQNGINVFNFGIPAFLSQDGTKTCPNAKACVSGCYARSGTYRFKNVTNAYETRLKVTQLPDFETLMIAEINLKLIQSRSKNQKCIIRIHDSGDFYSKDYAIKWFNIMRHFESQIGIAFYAYTKMIQMFHEFYAANLVPLNFTVIYSQGGTEDHLIDTSKMRHSRVFENETELVSKGYVNASQDDMLAIGDCIKIGLVYHGNKSYQNTTWHKVS